MFVVVKELWEKVVLGLNIRKDGFDLLIFVDGEYFDWLYYLFDKKFVFSEL